MGVFLVPSPANIDIRLAWDANTEADLAGYTLYYGTSFDGGSMIPLADVGNVVTYTATLPKRIYFFAVKAYNTTGLLSDFSNVVRSTL